MIRSGNALFIDLRARERATIDPDDSRILRRACFTELADHF